MDAKEIKSFAPVNRAAWRKWLQANHDKEKAVWLIYFKAASGKDSINYADAVDEALCFGWIDSKAQTLDADSYRQYFSRRKPKSVWSAINKKKVNKLEKEGLMQPAGRLQIEMAKANGSWNMLNEVEKRIIPPDLAIGFKKYPSAQQYFEGLAASKQKILLLWLLMAKKAETRAKRVKEIVQAAREKRIPASFS